MPSLETIQEDIPLMVDHFLKLIAREQDKPIKRVRPEVLNQLMAQPWPGNIRQLENLIRGWYAVISDTEITLRHLDAGSASCVPAAMDLEKPYQDLKEAAIGAFTRDYLNHLLRKTGGNVSAAAPISGMKRQTLQKIIRRYGIDVKRLRS